ncbi:MAG: exopolysaccharide biosynthesis polyprenyl glycosylphosphotransferase, partial [Gemmatimonadetes bacterium]|nr:exopolysaccharide biosynthesis polyprenyl glycosylphosphotransferase [Gemmatimonadota bacterium]
GCASGLESVVERHRISRVVVALEEHRGVLPMQSLLRLRVSGVEVEDSHSTMAALTGRVPLQTLRSSWFIFSDGFHRTGWTEVVKRALDLSLGLLGLVLSAPIMALAAIAIKWDSEGPVLYRQTRVGRRGKPFDVLKFRTMGADAETNGIPQWAEEDDPRVTRLGRFLRKYRVDELPQFVNVIRGQMSFVGPRPERPVFVEELGQIIPYYDERHTVRPGITGWAQVRYGYGGNTEEAMRKLEYDLFYLKNMSVWFDAAIVFETVKIVMFGRGGR